jgi:valyl-tRNA synthetase
VTRPSVASQRAFLRNLERGEAYQADAPTLWDVTFRTAVAQAELEDKDMPAAYHRVSFHKPDGGDVQIETTRPELLAACVALVAHPDDERYQSLFGTTVTTPVFGVEVPVLAHHLAQKDKGSGIAMICTFGDVTDVVWWRELDLPNRTIIGRDGRVIAEAPDALVTDEAKAAYAQIAGKTVFSAKAAMVELLRESGDLHGEPKPINHAVKFYEKGDKPLEIVSTRQWYITQRRPRRRAEGADAAGWCTDINFVPEFMRVRYENWVGGLTGDWLSSPVSASSACRSRSGTRSTPTATRCSTEPIMPTEESLPVDPVVGWPRPATTRSQRNQPGGFIGDLDVMDTWATSSLTPQLAGGWERDLRTVRDGLPVRPAPAGPGHHPHLAVLHRPPVSARARGGALAQHGAQRLHRRPRPQEDVEVQGQRRHPGRDAR